MPNSSLAQERKSEMLEYIERFRTLEQAVVQLSSSPKSQKKFRKRGKLLPRERLAHLLDPGAPFLELSTLAGFNMHDDDGKKMVMGGGTIIGIGFVSGTRVLVVVHDSAIKGGAISPMGLKKSLRAQEIALSNKLPMVSLVESAGANLLYQSELFVDGGRVFCNMARLSAAGIPQITVVHGSSTAGGAYMPGLSDKVIMVKQQAEVYLAGPPLVKAALGEDADSEQLGGAQMHATQTGSADYLAEDDAHGIALARKLVEHLGWESCAAHTGYEEPVFDAEELLGLVPVDFKQPYDVREVIARIVDGSEFLEFKATYGPTLICGHAHIKGHRVGIIGNNGPIYPAGAAKAAHFIQSCCQTNTPIVYLPNITGYMVGELAEQGGIVKQGALMIQAVSNATVPQISILIGGSFGAGNYGMCGRAFDPRFIFSWPNAKISVMGGTQAAKVLEIIMMNGLKRFLPGMPAEGVEFVAQLLKEDKSSWEKLLADCPYPITIQGLQMLSQGLVSQISKMGMPVDSKLEQGVLGQMVSFLEQKFDHESTSLYATARLWDDGIIDPRDTRNVVACALSVCREAVNRRLYPSKFGVARI